MPRRIPSFGKKTKTTSPFKVLDGGKGQQAQFICPWCGASFEARYTNSDGIESLQEHWLKSKRCGANKATNNPTQSKYRDNVEDD